MTFNKVMRFTALFLIPAMLSNSLAFAAKKQPDPAAMKQMIVARGLGQGVQVTLKDKTKAKGAILNIGDQNFTLKVKGVDQPRSIEYAQVTGVHNTGMTTGAKIGIVVAVIGVGVAVIIAVAAYEVTHSKW